MVTWQKDAACKGRGDLDWDSPVPSQDCLALCATCPVVAECLGQGLAFDVSWDVGCLGGTGPAERRAIREGTSCQRQLL
jgi:hypothetical protein